MAYTASPVGSPPSCSVPDGGCAWWQAAAPPTAAARLLAAAALPPAACACRHAAAAHTAACAHGVIRIDSTPRCPAQPCPALPSVPQPGAQPGARPRRLLLPRVLQGLVGAAQEAAQALGGGWLALLHAPRAGAVAQHARLQVDGRPAAGAHRSHAPGTTWTTLPTHKHRCGCCVSKTILRPTMAPSQPLSRCRSRTTSPSRTTTWTATPSRRCRVASSIQVPIHHCWLAGWLLPLPPVHRRPQMRLMLHCAAPH